MRHIYYKIVDKKIAGLASDSYIQVDNLFPFKILYENLKISKIKSINQAEPYKKGMDNERLFRFKIVDEITKESYESNISLVKPDTTKELWFRITDFAKNKNLHPGDIIRYSISYNENKDIFCIFISKVLRYEILLERKALYKYFIPKQVVIESDKLPVDTLVKFNIKKMEETTVHRKNSIDYVLFSVQNHVNKKYIGINTQFNLIEYFNEFKEIIDEQMDNKL